MGAAVARAGRPGALRGGGGGGGPPGEADGGRGPQGDLGHLQRARGAQDAGPGRRPHQDVWGARLGAQRALGQRREAGGLEHQWRQAGVGPPPGPWAEPRLRAAAGSRAGAPSTGHRVGVRQHWYAHTVGRVSELAQTLGLLHS